MVMKTLIILIMLSTPCYAGINFGSVAKDPAMITTLQNGSKVMHFNPIDSLYKRGVLTTEGKPTSAMARGFCILKTPMTEVKRTLDFDVIKFINGKRKTSDEKIVIFDWGCGEGAYLNELAKQLRRAGITNVELIGSSDLYFPAWHTNDPMITYILDDMHEMMKHDFCDKEKVDVVVSHFGLFHPDRESLVRHFNDWRGKLKAGGMIIYNSREYMPNALNDTTLKDAWGRYYSLHRYRPEGSSEMVQKLTLKPNGSTVYFGWEFVK